MLAKWRFRAVSNIRDYGIALMMGMATSVVATWIVTQFSSPAWMIGATTVLSDNIGFYGVLLAVRIRAIGSIRKASWQLVKEYWLAELLDSWVRASLLVLMAQTALAPWPSAFTANRLADLCFFAVTVFVGVDVSDLLIKGANKIRRK